MTAAAGADASRWRQADRRHHLHPFSDGAAVTRGAEVAVRGQGAFVYDADGRRCFDGAAGLWCVNVGYGRREIAEAMSRQVLDLSYASTFGSATTPMTAELAEVLAERAPGSLERVFFSTGGSLANETAVRIAQYHFRLLGQDGRRRVIALENAYHGSTLLTASLTGIARYRASLPTLDEMVIHVQPDISSLERAIGEAGPDTIACMIMEPLQGAGGVNVLPAGFHRAATDLCHRHGILVIADEVVTGFGRLGQLFSSAAVFDFEPDLMTLGKGITSGYFPLAGTLVSAAVADVLDSRPRDALLPHGFTHSGHPIGCAAALANLAIIDREDLCGHVRSVGPRFEEQIGELAGSPLVSEVRGCLFVAAVELEGEEAAQAVADECLARGLIVRPLGPNLVLSPPLIMADSQASWLVGTIAESLDAAALGRRRG